MSKNKDLSVDEAWEKLLEKYDIVKKIEEDGIFHIEASQIKEFKEPRLMSKWDSSEIGRASCRERVSLQV